MDHEKLIAIDIHTHAEVSCWNPFDNYGEEYDRAADKNFGNGRRPTIAETVAYYRERNRSEEHTSELQSRQYLVCRLLLEKKNSTRISITNETGKIHCHFEN